MTRQCVSFMLRYPLYICRAPRLSAAAGTFLIVVEVIKIIMIIIIIIRNLGLGLGTWTWDSGDLYLFF